MFRFLFNLMVLVLLIAGTGFLWFVFDVPKTRATEKVDAVVVLTGGEKRIEKGLEILRNDNATLMYISGVNKDVSLTDLQSSQNITAEEMQCCVITDQSENTRSNALTTAEWVEQNNIRTLRLVTTGYHMRRSLLEFRSLLPETVILPTPVTIKETYGKNWWQDKKAWETLGEEYLKYLVVQFRQFEEIFVKD